MSEMLSLTFTTAPHCSVAATADTGILLIELMPVYAVSLSSINGRKPFAS